MYTITDADSTEIYYFNKFMPINFKIKWANSCKNSACQMKQRIIENLNNLVFHKKLNPYLIVLWKINLRENKYRYYIIYFQKENSRIRQICHWILPNFQISKVEMIPALYERILSNLFYEASIFLLPNPSTDNVKKLSCVHNANDHNQNTSKSSSVVYVPLQLNWV